MSATGCGAKREPHDLYETPSWCVRRLLEVCPWLVKPRMWEPCMGRGAIVRAVNERAERFGREPIEWLATDLVVHDEGTPPTWLADATSAEQLWDSLGVFGGVQTAITNPPYSLASPILRNLRTVLGRGPASASLAALVRVGWLTPKGDRQWLREDYPDVWLLPDRPSFVKGRTDSCEYAWAVWEGLPKMWGKVQPLASTPLEERRRG